MAPQRCPPTTRALFVVMPARKKPKIFRPLQLGKCFTLSGGYSTKKHVPETRMFPRDGGEEVECILISHGERWLCEITTGKSLCDRPLARVHIIRELCKRLARKVSAAPAPDQQMAALAFDDDSSEGEETPNTDSPTKGGRFPGKRAGASAVAERRRCHDVRVPQRPSEPHTQQSVQAAMDDRGRVWLQVDCLPWLVQYIQAEKESGGVPPVVEPEEAEPRVQWNFQHSSWQALAVTPDGTKQRRERCVKARQKAGGMNFLEAKGTLYRETLEWLEAVEEGLPPQCTDVQMEP